MAQALVDEWSGQDVTIAQIERELARLRSASEGASNLRTSVMTHLAWVPPAWLDAAESTLEGMAERHPSRTIILVPKGDEANGLDAELSVRCFPLGESHVCGEVIGLSLRGSRVVAPASIVLPLLISDLPVFCRWRGLPEFHEVFDELVDVTDRLIVDSTEWPSDTLSQGYGELARRFDRTAVSDIAWERTERWRRMLAAAWPFEARSIRVQGTHAQAALLGGWLRSRLGHDVAVENEPAESLLSVHVDGRAIDAPPGEAPPSSDLLSDELERFTRDRTYEDAVRAAAAP